MRSVGEHTDTTVETEMFRIVALAAALPLFVLPATAQMLENRQLVRQSSLADGSHPAVRGDTISLNGSFLRARWDMTMEEFLAVPEDEIHPWLRFQLEPGGHVHHISQEIATGRHPVVYVYLDIEWQLHPKHLWKYWDPAHHPEPTFTRQEVADAFAMRLRVTKEVFKELHPEQDVRVGLFSTLEPQPGGWPTDPPYLKRLANLTELASLGMLDPADFLVPVLFARFASTAPAYDKLERYAMQGLDGSAQLRRSDGSSIPMMPQLSIRIYNGGQPTGLIRTSWLQEMIDVIRNSGHRIEAIGFWVAPSERDECAFAYFDRLFAPQDWNYDCVSDEQDDFLFASAMADGEPMADMNRDGVINGLDWQAYRGEALLAPSTFACGAEVECPCPIDFFDFLLFQELFALGDPAADMNGDGVLDFFDFIVFQEQAANRCP